MKSSDKEKQAAYGQSAAWKAGGVATGAAAGAMLGSLFPVWVPLSAALLVLVLAA